MRAFLIFSLMAAFLSACHPGDPRNSGLYASARDVLPAGSAKIAACLARVMPGPVRRHSAPDGSWLLVSDGARVEATWELRLTRIDANHTEVEIDASLRDPARGDALARAAAACAGR